jgi:UDP-N-acetylglucosamine 2-epimerase
MRKIVTIIGTRPQLVKVAPVSRVLRKQFHEVLVNTGQHYDYNMAGVFFEELQIPRPDYDLGVGSGSHGRQTGEMLIRLEELLLKEKPDAVLVYGDTNSTLAGALAASKLHMPLMHIEAGLRSFNKRMPEELNRIMTDHVSDLLFAPTDTAVQNLAAEGITRNVHQVGDVMYDAMIYNASVARNKYDLKRFGVTENAFFLATIHRAENTDDPVRLRAIFESLMALNADVVLPLHPRTRNRLKDSGIDVSTANAGRLKIVDPVSYLEMLLLETNARGIITDSGGVQKEAYFARKPCFTLRPQTEWVETVQAGWNCLVDVTTERLSDIIADKLKDTPKYVENLYGDGKAAEKIVSHITDFLGG